MIGDLSEVSVNWVLISHRCESDKTKSGPPHFESSGAIAFHKGNKTNCLSYYSSMLSAGKVTCPYVSVNLIQLICKIASLHAPKVLQFLHRFQNCFCFRSILFVMQVWQPSLFHANSRPPASSAPFSTLPPPPSGLQPTCPAWQHLLAAVPSSPCNSNCTFKARYVFTMVGCLKSNQTCSISPPVLRHLFLSQCVSVHLSTSCSPH